MNTCLFLQLLCCALNCCVNELRSKNSDSETVASLPWVHAAYHEFQNRLQNLSRMICIEPQVTQELLRNLHGRDGDELVSLLSGFLSIILSSSSLCFFKDF